MGRYRRRQDHHVVLIDHEGRRLMSRRVANDEVELCEAIDDVLGRATTSWAAPSTSRGLSAWPNSTETVPVTTRSIRAASNAYDRAIDELLNRAGLAA